jgi:Cu(I)/Ag(I) efflux system membrane protein CusA/SilA
MLLYLEPACAQWQQEGWIPGLADLRDAIYRDAGIDVVKRIATPVIGGGVTSTVMELAVYPAIFFLWRFRSLKC